VIGDVAAVEFRARWRDGRTRLAGAMVALAIVAALASAAGRYVDVAAERATAQRVVEAQWLEQGEKNPHAAAHYGLYAFRPAGPLAFFDPGVSAYEGVAIWLEAHRRNLPQGRPADDWPPLARFGELSVAFALQVLMPLLVILLGYDAFAGERERGTLRQVLSQGVAPTALLWGKLAGLLATVASVLGPLVLAGLAALGVTPAGRAALPAALALTVAYAAYACAIALLTLATSARARSAQAALVTLLAFWVVATFVVPRLAADVGRVLHPVPSAAEFEQTLEADMQGASRGTTLAERIEKRRAQLLKLYRAEDVAALPVNFQGLVFSLQEEFGNEVFDRRFGELDARLRSQDAVHAAFALASPRLAIAQISQELSGTSVRQLRAFADHAEAFRRRFIALLNEALLYRAKPGEAYRAGPELWVKVGEYHYEEPGLAARLSALGAPLTVLVLWLAGTLVTARVAVRGLKASVA
jgi:ABC-2 type transport system permease protein